MAVFKKPMSLLPTLVRHVRQMSVASTFKYSDLEIELCKESRPKPDPDNLVFGREFSDHMLEIDWTATEGWGKPRICPVHNFSMHPAAKVFHYAVELYEGIKAYRGEDQIVRIFRPDKNMKRMNRTATRATLPTFDGDELINCVRKLVSIDQEWVPYSTSSTLYVRPTMMATEACLGVSVSNDAKLFVISGPVGPYYPTGFKPVTLLADPKYVRASPGGAGSYKMGSNYAPTIYIQNEAAKQGCQQVLWLYGPDHMVTEVGTMNFFMYWVNEQGEEELITPPLELDIILPGVTRLSLLELSRQWGEFKVSEKAFTMKDIAKGLKEGRVKELFGAGTACVVSPIDNILYAGQMLKIPTMEKGAPLTSRFHKELLDIQFARKPSNWMVDVDDAASSKAKTAASSG